jgi:hypothetical protein
VAAAGRLRHQGWPRDKPRFAAVNHLRELGTHPFATCRAFTEPCAALVVSAIRMVTTSPLGTGAYSFHQVALCKHRARAPRKGRRVVAGSSVFMPPALARRLRSILLQPKLLAGCPP